MAAVPGKRTPMRSIGYGEGDSPRVQCAESPPHPKPSASTSPRKRGEVTRTLAPIQSEIITLYSRVTRSRSALPTTLTDDSAIAAAAMIGDSSRPNAG